MQNRLIYGKDDTKLITNISFKDNQIYVYKANNTVEKIAYKPWVISKSPSPKYDHIKLKGNQYYRYLTHLDTDKYKEVTDSWNNKVWSPRGIEEGFMLLNGYTYFKDLKINQVSLLSFDIEATSLDPDDPNAEVLLISTTFRDRCGQIQRRLFDKFETDDIVADFSSYVRKLDPDILMGHNIFGYDIKYLAKHGKLNLGRDGSELTFNEKPSKFRKDGSQQYEYNDAKVHGRTLVDTFFLSIKYDIGRSFPSYGLKQIEKHLGLVDNTRIEWDFTNYPTSKYKSWPSGKWEEFRQYCNDDSDSPIKMFDLMGPTFFYLNQSIPKTFQQLINEATGSQLDSFMIRAYLQDGYSQPQTSQKEEFEGAISFGIPGNYKNVFSVDFHALYPSIIKQYKIYDKKKDPSAYMLEATKYFTEVRVEYKNKFKETGNIMYDGMQQAAKVCANSIYGFMGSGYLLYNSPSNAALVTKHGRDLLDTICRKSTGIGVLEWKTQIK